MAPPTRNEAAVATAAPVRPQPKPATNSASSTMFVRPQAMLVAVPSSGRPAVMQKGCSANCSMYTGRAAVRMRP